MKTEYLLQYKAGRNLWLTYSRGTVDTLLAEVSVDAAMRGFLSRHETRVVHRSMATSCDRLEVA